MAFLPSILTAMFLLIPSTFAQEVQNITLRPTPQSNGLFTVDISWEPPADAGDIASYQLYQIQGVGGSLSAPHSLPATTSTLRINDVPSNNVFGVSIQIVWKDGHISHGAFASIGSSLPIPASPLPASVASPVPPPATGLSREDFAMIIFVVIAGAAVGTLSVRLFRRA